MNMRKKPESGRQIAIYLRTEASYGGQHHYAVLLAELLLKNGGFVAICGTRFWVNWCRKHGVEYIEQPWVDFAEDDLRTQLAHPVLTKLYYRWQSELGGFLRKKKIDVLLVAQQGWALPPCPCRVILPAHDLMHRYFRRFPEIPMADFEFRETYFKYAVQFADAVLTDSELGKQQFNEAYAHYMRPGFKVFSLPFVPAPFVWKGEEEFVETPQNYIFYPAQFWSHKNHLNLIRALELVKNELPDIKLLFVGSEKNSQKIVKQYIKDHDLEAHVLIYGFVNDQKMAYLYRHATAMFMPSYFGPTNVPPLEAMALGCPVAVANNFAMPEQVGDAGLTFSPDSPQEMADCIRKIWTDEQLRAEMIKKGYERAAKWTRDDFEKRLLQILGNV